MSTAQPDSQPETGFIRLRKSRLAWFGLLILVILVTAFFIAGNRGGEDAWQKYRRELEAKGEKLDWESFIPPPVPDDQNFFKAPGMTAWFSKQTWQSNRVSIFELPGWVRNWPITLEQMRALPEREDAGDAALASSGSREKLRLWFAQLDAEYHLLVDASARPATRFEADYRDAVAMDIPNFVNERCVVQALATHASLSVLDGKPEITVQDLFLIRRLADLSGSSPTLVGAMIRVAIMGIYTQTARDAIESGAFSDAQLKAIQDQLQEMDLLADLAQSLRAVRATEVRLLTLPPEELEKLLQQQLGDFNTKPLVAFWQVDWKAWFDDLRFKFHLHSRNWLSENMATLCRFHQEALDQMDVRDRRFRSTELDHVFSRMQQTFTSSPSTAQLAAIIMPNYSRASLTVVRTQTQLDQLRVACALERYRLAHSSFPEKLDALIPAYLDRVPNDLFTDQPLQYRRNDQGGYQLWSVGWNEKDDGGAPSFDKDGKPAYDTSQGDWVWSYSH